MHDFCLVIFTLKNLQDLLLLGSFSRLRYHFGRLVWKSTEYTFGISPLWSVCQLERRAPREGWDLPGTKQWEPTHCRNRQPGSRVPLCTHHHHHQYHHQHTNSKWQATTPQRSENTGTGVFI